MWDKKLVAGAMTARCLAPSNPGRRRHHSSRSVASGRTDWVARCSAAMNERAASTAFVPAWFIAIKRGSDGVLDPFALFSM